MFLIMLYLSLYLILFYFTIMVNIFQKISGQIASNVTGIRRFGQAIGLCEANVPCPNCGGKKTVPRAKPDYGFL
jgi:dihydroorotate dehydrogenase